MSGLGYAHQNNAHQNNGVLRLEMIIAANETEEQGLPHVHYDRTSASQSVMKWSRWHAAHTNVSIIP